MKMKKIIEDLSKIFLSVFFSFQPLGSLLPVSIVCDISAYVCINDDKSDDSYV